VGRRCRYAWRAATARRHDRPDVVKIAFLANDESANGWYRAIYPMQALAARGHSVRLLASSRRMARVESVHGCDIVHIHRQHDAPAMAIMQYARRAGIPVIWDNDDDLDSYVAIRAGGIDGVRRDAAGRRTTPSRLLMRLSSHNWSAASQVFAKTTGAAAIFTHLTNCSACVCGRVAGLPRSTAAARPGRCAGPDCAEQRTPRHLRRLAPTSSRCAGCPACAPISVRVWTACGECGR
jgi:hypothetical protein